MQMKKVFFMGKKRLIYMLFMMLILALGVSQPVEAKKAKKTYKVSVSTKTLKGQYQQRAANDKKAKTTYMLRSYMEKLAKDGGGTLVLKKGTYKIYENLYVPSNTTIRFEKGVKLVAQNRASLSSIFIPMMPSKTTKANYAKGYKAAKNVKFEGGENVVIDLGKSNSSAFYLAHNNKITISGIQFKKNNSKRHIIELMGASNVTISNCTFTGKNRTGSAIAVDMPAKKKTRTRKWCKMDDTVNKNVTITKCSFNNLYRAITTMRYVDKKYHKGFKITDNTITNIKDDAIRAINWSGCKITGNTIKTVGTGGTHEGPTKSLKRGIYVAGVQNPEITGNNFEDLPRAIELNVYKNSDSELKKYKETKNKVSQSQMQAMLDNNTVTGIREYTIRVYKSAAGSECDRYYFKDDTTNYVIQPDDIPYRNEYTNYSTYNNNTRQYYVFRAVMDQIERNGKPCTITVKAGTYKITNEFPVANNVTVYLEDGVKIQKYDKTGIKDYPANSGLFTFVEPKHYSTSKLQYSGYNGVHDVKILGPENGTAVMDLSSYPIGIALIIGHAKNIEIANITFTGGNNGHYIELDASQNVVVRGCTFKGHTDSESINKEAINLDTPDKNTQGFIRGWTSYDKTANHTIRIVDNVFTDLEVGVGTHSYSENKPHKNIVIERNSFSNCDAAAITAMNWENVSIVGNTIENVALHTKKEYALELSGVNGATMQNNVISNVEKIARIKMAKQSGKSAVADAYAPVASNITLSQKNTFVTTNTFRAITKPVVECENNVVGSLNGTWDLSSYVK